MTISLPSEVMGNLPDPDQNGLIRLVVAVRPPSKQGEDATVVEINDVPVAAGDEQDSAEEQPAADESESMPDPQDIERQVYGGQ